MKVLCIDDQWEKNEENDADCAGSFLWHRDPVWCEKRMLHDDALAMILLKYAFFSKYSITKVSIFPTNIFPISGRGMRTLEYLGAEDFLHRKRRACRPPLPIL
jgi:hypothetical protein